MDVRDEIIAQVDKLPPELQLQVLRFVTSLATGAEKGESGAGLRAFAGSLDAVSAREMVRAIEEACE